MKNTLKKKSWTLAAVLAMTVGAQAADQFTLAHWSFNYDYTINNGVGTPSSTAQKSNGTVNLHDVKLAPNEQRSDGAYLTAHRATLATAENQVEAQDNKGAYLEVNAISCDGAALHMTSPVPTPEAASTSYTYGDNTATFPDGNSYSYQNPYNYFEIEVPTTGYKNIKIELKAAGHQSASQYYAVAFSSDKASWTIVGDEYLTGASYNRWVNITVALDGLTGLEKAYIRVFPADNWKGANNNINSDNQFDLDDVYIYGEVDGNVAEITGFNVNGTAATETTDAAYDYEYLVASDYAESTITIAPQMSYTGVTVQAEDEEGDTQTVTDNGDGTFSIKTPNQNGYYLLTFTLVPESGAVATTPSYTLRVFHLGAISLTSAKVNSTALDADLLKTLNSTGKATLSGNVYTQMPKVTATVIDNSVPTITETLDGTMGTYTIAARDSIFKLNVEGIHLYTMGENDEDITLTYSSDGKSAYEAEGEWTDGWTNGLYTLRTTGLDGWGGSQFKFNGTQFKLEIPGGVVVKTFALERYGANYGNGEGLTSFSSEGATCYVPTDHGYTRGAKDTVIVVLENHQAGQPLYFSITGGSQPYAQLHLVIEKTNPGTTPVVTSKTATVINRHAMISVAFDREMPITTATFNGQETTAESGTTLTFGVDGLDYNTDYTFMLPAGTVVDLFGNQTTEDITVQFSVGAQQDVEKKPYDYVVGTTDEFTAAIKAIGSSTNKSLDRVVIFMKNGDYDFGENNEQRINRGNVSIVGQSKDGVIIHGTRTGISNPILNIRDREGFYLQDITVRNDLDFGTARKGVGVAIYGGNKSIFKNVCMQSQQDTQVTGERSYYDGCTIQGTVDFICGGGNHFYDKCDIILEGSGAVIAAPATTSTCKYGYVFSHCTVSPNENATIADGDYTLARPWQNEPRVYNLYTKMNVKPTDNGYSKMSNLITHFYEFGSVDKDGNEIDLSVRGNSSSSTNSYTPVISEAEAKTFTVMNVLSETDGWLPTDYTELLEAPQATVSSDGVITWPHISQARGYVIFKDGKYVADVAENSFAAPEVGTYVIQTANQMGGLGTEAITVNVVRTAISEVQNDTTDSADCYNLSGQKVGRDYHGIVVSKGKKYYNK